ncbi:MAG: glycosyltransferase [bacterium]
MNGQWQAAMDDFDMRSAAYQRQTWGQTCRQVFADEGRLEPPAADSSFNYSDIRLHLAASGIPREVVSEFVAVYVKLFHTDEKPVFGAIPDCHNLNVGSNGFLSLPHPWGIIANIMRSFACDRERAVELFRLHLPQLKAQGVRAMEVAGFEQQPELEGVFAQIADEAGLDIVAGSDFHGRPVKNNPLGAVAPLTPSSASAEISTLRLDEHYQSFGATMACLDNPVPVLEARLQEGDQYDQYLATAWVIVGAEGGKISPHQAALLIEPLTQCLRAPQTHPVIQDFCALALGSLGGTKAINHLIDRLAEAPKRSPERKYYLRRAIEKVLVGLDDAAFVGSIERVEAILDSSDASPVVKADLISTLGMVALNSKRFHEMPHLRERLIVQVLGQVGAIDAAESPQLHSCVRFLGDMRAHSSTPALLRLHETTSDEQVKRSTYEALLDIYLDFEFPVDAAHAAILARDPHKAQLAEFFRDDAEIGAVRQVFSQSQGNTDKRLSVMEVCFHGLLDIELNGLGSADTGGQIVYAVELAKSVAASKEAKVVVFTRKIHGQEAFEKTEYLVDEGMAVVRIPFGPEKFVSRTDMWKYGSAFVRQVKRFFRLTNFKTDVIHIHSVDGASVELMRMARQEGYPVVFTVHSCGLDKIGSLSQDGKITGSNAADKNERSDLFFRILNEELSLLWSDRVIVSTQGEVDSQWASYWHSADFTDKFRVVPPGIDHHTFSPAPVIRKAASTREVNQAIMSQLTRQKIFQMYLSSIAPEHYGKPAILFLSRLTPRKNPGLLLDLFLESKMIMDNYVLLLAGGGSHVAFPHEPNFFRSGLRDSGAIVQSLEDYIVSQTEITRRNLSQAVRATYDSITYRVLAESSLGGEEKEAYLDLCRTIEENPILQGRVAFLGSLDHYLEVPEAYRIVAKGIPPFIGPHGIFCNPALYEPFGLTILESMASEVITLATANGGPSETIQHGRTGFLFDPSDIDNATRAFEQVASLPRARKAVVGRSARQVIESRYSWPNRAADFLRVYAEAKLG